MNNYRCPKCGCDEFILALRTYAYYHLELMDDSLGRYLTRKEKIDVKEEVVELVVCCECHEEFDYDAPPTEADSAA